MEHHRFKERNNAIDMVRAIAMLLMTLDHVRYFFSNATCHPLDLRCTTSGLFLTRWVTHFAAPVFVFLAGTSAFLMKERKQFSDRELAGFLCKRGVFCILLEFTLVRMAWLFRFADQVVTLQVIWVLGVAMIFLSLLVYTSFLSARAIGIIGLVMVLAHNLFNPIYSDVPGVFDAFWKIVHQYGSFDLGGLNILVVYPLVPWIGVMALGYWCGTVFSRPQPTQQKIFFAMGGGTLLLFLILRIPNLYGDYGIWWTQKNMLFTFYSFINCMKYPPSLLFLLMTLGPCLILVGLLIPAEQRWMKPFLVIGRVPLFYYLIHLFIIHTLAVFGFYLKYHTLYLQKAAYPEGHGFDLPKIYIVWIIVVVTLYPLCVWYAGYKKRHTSWWISYF